MRLNEDKGIHWTKAHTNSGYAKRKELFTANSPFPPISSALIDERFGKPTPP
jgi:hypothetical protein